MNKVHIFLIVAVMIAAIGCGGRGSGGSQGVDGVITMTTEIQEVTLYLTGYGEATIDWGDGSQPQVVELYEMPGFGFYNSLFRYRRTYPTQEQRIITISGNITLLICSDNYLNNLDISRAPTLLFLDCSRNGLTALDVSQNAALTTLHCSENGLTALDVSRNTALSQLVCDKNQLTALNLSRNTALTVLDCRNNLLTALDVSRNIALTTVRTCNNSQLTALDVSQNIALLYLECRENRLTTLDVSRNTALTYLVCRNNLLTALDMSRNDALETLDITANQFTAEALDALFGTLYDNDIQKVIDISNNPGSSDCDPAIAEAKGWQVEGFEGERSIINPENVATRQYAGIYRFSASNIEGAGARVYIYPETDETVLFYLEKSIGAPSYNSGEMDGRVTISDGKGTFTYSEFCCVLHFTFDENALTIKQEEDCDCGFGANVFVNDTLERTSSEIPEYYYDRQENQIFFSR